MTSPLMVAVIHKTWLIVKRLMWNGCLDRGCWAECSWLLFVSLPFPRKVEDLQFRVEEESITKGDLEVIPYDLAKMWGPKLHVGPHLSNFCHILLPSNNTLLIALDHGVNCEDCSLVGCPMTIHSWICHSELPAMFKSVSQCFGTYIFPL